jgi:hypothetical protein
MAATSSPGILVDLASEVNSCISPRRVRMKLAGLMSRESAPCHAASSASASWTKLDNPIGRQSAGGEDLEAAILPRAHDDEAPSAMLSDVVN